jgi:hypothetical protein
MRSILAAFAITTAMAALTAVAAEPEGKLARVGRVYTGAPSTTQRSRNACMNSAGPRGAIS